MCKIATALQEFLPERFLEETNGQLKHNPNAYIPFGAGPRKCIGYRYCSLIRFMGIS